MKEKIDKIELKIDDPIVLEEFGNRIKKARNKKKISQDKLGELLSITRQAISKWENGKSIPDISIWRKISEVLEVDLSDFVNMVDNPINDNSNIKIENNKDLDIKIKEVVTEDKVLEDKKIINTQKEAINFSIDKKKLIIVFTLFVSLALFFVITFFIFFRKNENYEETDNNEWKQIDFISDDKDIQFTGNVIYNNDESIFTFKNFFYTSPLLGTKKEAIIKKINVYLYIENEEIYSFTHSKDPVPLHDFLDNISISLNYKNEYDSSSNIVIKFVFVQKNGKEILKQIVAVPQE